MASIVSQLRAGAPQKPTDKNRKIQVIGSGMGRTGTMSLSAALEILLEGKVYHTGTMIFADEEATMRRWGRVMNPDSDVEDSKKMLREMLEGYMAITDTWGAAMTPELLDMYPDAIVIVTTREPDAWWKSWSDMTSSAPGYWIMQLMFLPVPVFRYFPFAAAQVWRRLGKLYGLDGLPEPRSKWYITIHNEWLKRAVPPAKLHFFDVKQGWEPLCKILNVPVPDEPFPRANEQAAMKELGERIMGEVKKGWGLVVGGVVVSILGIIIRIRYLR